MENDIDKLLEIKEEYFNLRRSNFAVIIRTSSVLPSNNPRFNESQTKIAIYSIGFLKLKKINIKGNNYDISDETFEKIKEYSEAEFQNIHKYALIQNAEYLRRNMREGGVSGITIKYNNITIDLNGYVSDNEISDYCNNFINTICNFIIDNNNN